MCIVNPDQNLMATVRALRGQADARITLAPGIHRLTETLTLTPDDSGLTLGGEPGAVLSGNAAIPCAWREGEHGIYSTPVPDGIHVGAQLFINGERATLARWPKVGYAPVLSTLPESIDTERQDEDMFFPGAPPRGLLYDPAGFTPRRWSKPELAVCHVFQAMYWGNMQFRLLSRDDRAGALVFGDGGTQIGAKWNADPCKINERSKFYVENVLEELTMPGEWCFDPDTRMLFYLPPDGFDIHAASFETPQIESLIAVRGTRERPVSDVTIMDIRLTGTLETYFEEYDIPSLGDWSIHRGGCVMFDRTRGCTIERCDLSGLGGNAVFFNGYNRGALALGNRVRNVGESAFCLVGEQSKVVGNQRLFPFECRVEHNIISDCGRFGKQVAGVFISVARRITAGHNYIHHMPRAGICINDGTWGGHVIEYNHIHDTCLETGDHGPLNAWGRDRYWCLLHSHGPSGAESVCHQAGNIFVDQMETVVIRGNFFKEKSGWGLDLDDGASNYHIHDNICVGVSMKLREGAHRLIENNVWVNGANSPCFHVGNVNNHDCYRRNITVMDTQNANPEHDLDFEMGRHNGEMYTLIKPPVNGPWLEELDYNLFFNDRGEFSARAITGESGAGQRHKYSLTQWQQMGFDRHSLFADPGFVDPAHDDYRLRPDSPALTLGISSIDMSALGPAAHFKAHWEDTL